MNKFSLILRRPPSEKIASRLTKYIHKHTIAQVGTQANLNRKQVPRNRGGP